MRARTAERVWISAEVEEPRGVGGVGDIEQHRISRFGQARTFDSRAWIVDHPAAMFDRTEIVEYLVSRGANLDATDASDVNAADVAQRIGASQALAFLQQSRRYRGRWSSDWDLIGCHGSPGANWASISGSSRQSHERPLFDHQTSDFLAWSIER
jgi:hypothetical protein